MADQTRSSREVIREAIADWRTHWCIPTPSDERDDLAERIDRALFGDGRDQRVQDRDTETRAGWPTGHEMVVRLREALGLFAGAMPITPERAWEEALDEVARLRHQPLDEHPLPWRTGGHPADEPGPRQRTIYDATGEMIGAMFTTAAARRAVDAVNGAG